METPETTGLGLSGAAHIGGSAITIEGSAINWIDPENVSRERKLADRISALREQRLQKVGSPVLGTSIEIPLAVRQELR